MNLQRASSVLEVVSYWNDTLVEIDHIQAGGFGEILSLHEDGYRFHLEPDMQALLQKGDGPAIEPQGSLIEVGRQDILHIKQGNLNFVFAYVNIPGVTLPRLTQRDGFAWVVLFLSLFLYCAAITLISLTQITPKPEDDFKPWLELTKPLMIELPPLPKPKAPEPVPPSQLAPKPVAPQAAPPKAIAPKPGRAMEPAAPPGAAAPASTPPGRSLRDLGKIRGLNPSSPAMNQPSPFRGSSGDPSGARGSSRVGSQNLPGIGNNGSMEIGSARQVADGIKGSGGTSLGDAALGSGFEGSQGRPQIGIQPQDPVTEGSLDAREVQAVVRTHLNEIRHCYEQFLQRSADIGGRVKVNFVIGGSGAVTSARIVDNTLGDADLGNCISGKIERWKFPAPRNSQAVKVNYPFLFTPR